MKKKLTFLMAGVIALSGFAVGAMSKTVVEKIEAELRGDFTVVIDGKTQTFRNANGEQVDPILYDGTTYLPVRAIGEIMGKTVYWYQDEKRIELVEPSEKSLVTDADVIVDGADKVNTNKEKNTTVKKAEKVVPQAEITLEEAKEIALDKAGLKESEVTFTKAKLDYDDGEAVYEIDFKTTEQKYDAEVNAVTGDVTEWEVETIKTAVKVTEVVTKGEITLEEAKEIALDKAGLKESEVTFTKAKLDYDNGKTVYEIEFVKDRVEYEAEINAVDGTIVEWNIDKD